MAAGATQEGYLKYYRPSAAHPKDYHAMDVRAIRGRFGAIFVVNG